MKTKFSKIFILAAAAVVTSQSLLANVLESSESSPKPLKEFYIEYFDYYEYLYSNSRKTEVGDTVELDVSLKYNFSESTEFLLGFETIPENNRADNETSKFEVGAKHQYKNFELEFDLELQTNDGSTGGTTFGLDLDSEDTYLKYNITKNSSISFHPFNFDGEVGGFFNTWDVTRIYFVEGSPSAISQTQTGDESIAMKTIPGLVYEHRLGNFKLLAGIGKTTYLYPTNEDFDITDNNAATSWEKREDTGYLAKLKYDSTDKDLKARIEYVGHTEADETGSLLESAASVRLEKHTSNLIFSTELTYSKASSSAWRIDRSSDWFESLSPFSPVYSDTLGNKQDWLGEGDIAYSIATGIKLNDSITPYIFYRHQGEHFIFRERESAHELRTSDESLSHGGLTRLGLGINYYIGKFRVVSELEYLSAKNAVFTNSSQIRSDRQNSTFKRKDHQLVIKVDYNFDGKKFFGIL